MNANHMNEEVDSYLYGVCDVCVFVCVCSPLDAAQARR